jgi:hypothetical protein
MHPALAAPLATDRRCPRSRAGLRAAGSLDLPFANAVQHRPATRRSPLYLAGALDFTAAVGAHVRCTPRSAVVRRYPADTAGITRVSSVSASSRLCVVPTAPGIAGGEGSTRADVFGLAALMHELMWADGSAVSGRRRPSLTAIRHRPRGAAERVRPSPEAADRFETALEFAEALKNACPDNRRRPRTGPRRSWPGAKRNRASRFSIRLRRG